MTRKITPAGLTRLFEGWNQYAIGSKKDVGFWDPVTEAWVERSGTSRLFPVARPGHPTEYGSFFKRDRPRISLYLRPANASELADLGNDLAEEGELATQGRAGWSALWDPTPDQWYIEQRNSSHPGQGPCAEYEANVKATREQYNKAVSDCAALLDRGGSVEAVDECQATEVRRLRAELTTLAERFPNCTK